MIVREVPLASLENANYQSGTISIKLGRIANSGVNMRRHFELE